ncbi:hypothetical protein AAG570_003125 [Ranatra chinensis]|uniref:Phospholipid/glycerol acyltransferase domain-containing protein n=1 Tax=Ranatra chinensis TaxID=642074 RepID=A0ABD0Y6Z6_9HEMI
MNNRVDIKVVLLGNENVGKTTLLERFINERFIERPYQSTIGAAFAAKDLTSNGRKFIIGVWDTAGSERYRAMLKMFYRNAKAAIICYDICDETSWGQLRSWISELRNHEEDCVIYICGTKKDLVDDGLREREITHETASKYAKSIQVKQIETSSKTGENVVSVLVSPLCFFTLAIVFFAAIGKSLGVRRAYVKLLVKIFEFGRKTLEAEKKWQLGGKEDEVVKDTGTPVSDNNGTTVISREDLILAPDPEQNYVGNNNLELPQVEDGKGHLPRPRSFETLRREFQLSDTFDFVKAGVEAIIEDQVTSRFEAEELKSWNLLTRTNRQYEFISWRLSFIWVAGFFIRYFFLLPLRVLICFFGVMWLTFCTALVGYVPVSDFKRWLNQNVSIMCFNVLSSALSSVIMYHNPENRPKRGICVANHTSPIDVLVLMCDNSYSLIGQRHGGFLGIFQRALARASPHIWFERSEVKDREAVARRLREHVSDPKNPPILIFPEGTCINNTSVMQFKKGSFEVGSVIYPVAIKYDPKFGDAFWNSSRYSMIQYLYMMMTSWAIVADVWYLPPMYQNPDETAIDFANRVKRVISKQGGLVDLMWDGQLKRIKVKKEWKERQQEEFSKRLKVE